MSDSEVIWMDGELVPYAKATVPVLSHSLHYGSAAFEGVRAYKTISGRPAIFKAQEHMQRFVASSRILGGSFPYTPEQLVEGLRATIKANGFEECYIRPLAYIGDDIRGLKVPTTGLKMHVAIATWKWGKYLGDAALNGIKCCVASFRRPDAASSLPAAKLSGNYLNSIMARREASLRGCDEAILLDQQGFVAEGSGENIFVVKGGKIATPTTNNILPGLTRDAVMTLAATCGYTVRECNLTRNDLYDADEVFFTGTAAEVTPIREIDGYTIGSGAAGPVTKKLLDLFERSVKGQLPEFEHWLTYV